MKPQKFLMCPPAYFEVAYSINPYMTGEDVDKAKAYDQWLNLVRIFRELGAKVLLLDAVPRLPDMVFAANAAFPLGKKVMMTHFRHRERAFEVYYYHQWFKAHKFKSTLLTPWFEGQGDALLCGDKIICGYGMRSDGNYPYYLKETFKKEIVPVKLVDPYFYHLDIALLPIDADTLMYYPDAFDGIDFSRGRLRQNFRHLIEVSREEALTFGLNSVRIGNTFVVPKGGEPIGDKIRKLGYKVIYASVSEFQKSGGAVKCMTLELY